MFGLFINYLALQDYNPTQRNAHHLCIFIPGIFPPTVWERQWIWQRCRTILRLFKFYHRFSIIHTNLCSQFPILNASSILGRILPATLAPRCGVINLAIFCTLCMGTLMFCLRAVTDTGGLIAFSVIYGFFSGGGMSDDHHTWAFPSHDVYFCRGDSHTCNAWLVFSDCICHKL